MSNSQESEDIIELMSEVQARNRCLMVLKATGLNGRELLTSL